MGTFPGDRSPFGLLDMAGNVQEWTASSHSGDYSKSPGVDRVFRGGGWTYDNPALVRGQDRHRGAPTERNIEIGFRCAR